MNAPLLTLALLLTGISSYAPAGLASEQTVEHFVHKNITSLLHSAKAEPSQIIKTITTGKIVDFPLLAKFTLGRYGRLLNKSSQQEYETVLLDFYQGNLIKYSDAKIDITGSTRLANNDFIVKSVVSGLNQPPLNIEWRVQKHRDGNYRIADIAINIDGNLLWLLQEQRAQFIAIIDQANGNVQGLIDKMKKRTSDTQAFSQ